ncbi:MAG: hypothetical protein J7480_09430, partial [Microbacteriaceae bacterium]|nr:hypothetical protein [Microbacteriaceae bacterium]
DRSSPACFHVRAAMASGVTRKRLRGRDLRTPFRGVRVPVDRDVPARPEEAHRRRALEYAPRLAEGQAFCAATALALWGLPMPGRPEREPVHVNAVLGGFPPRVPGASGHRFAAEVRHLDGLPLVGPVDARLQCAAAGGALDELVIIGDAMTRRVEPFATVDELARAVEGAARRRGSKTLASALPLIRPRTDSPGETRLRLLIVRAGFPEPEVNVPVLDARGAFLGFGDLVFRDAGVAIEYEGGHHFDDIAQTRHDLDRLAAFERAGTRVLRTHSGTLTAPALFFADLRRLLALR